LHSTPPFKYNTHTMSNHEERLLTYRRVITVIAVIIVLVLAFLIIKPFLIALIGAAVLAYLFYPVYRYMAERLPKFLPQESIAAALTVVLIFLIVLIPMSFIAGLLANEARSGYVVLQRFFNHPASVISLPPLLQDKMGDISNYREPLLTLATQFINWVQGIVISLPRAFLSILITIFSIYFFLKGAPQIYGFFQDFFPLPEGRYQEIFERFDSLSRGIVLGQIVVGILHGFLAWGAYSLLGVPNAVLWAFLTAIISIIPILGASLVWFPIAVYLFVAGWATGTYWKGLVLFAYGVLVITTVDNFLKPKIMGDNARIHPLIILLGILGGIQLMGLPGILIGPLILALLDVVMSILREVV